MQVQFDTRESEFMTRITLYQAFHKFGRVRKIVIPERSTEGSESRASAFVHFDDTDAVCATNSQAGIPWCRFVRIAVV